MTENFDIIINFVLQRIKKYVLDFHKRKQFIYLKLNLFNTNLVSVT